MPRQKIKTEGEPSLNEHAIRKPDEALDIVDLVSDAEIAAQIAPYVIHEFDCSDRDWVLLEKNADRSERAGMIRARWARFAGLRDVSCDDPGAYENWYKTFNFDSFLPDKTGKSVPVRWNNRGFLLSPMGVRRASLLLLTRFLQRIAPESVCEIGSGSGVNAFLVANQLPDTKVTALEISAHGVRIARETRDLPELPAALKSFSPTKFASSTHFKSVDFVRGDGARLPFANNSFDVLYTCWSLEAMEAVRVKALAELSRVARRYVIMTEPFRDVNRRGARRSKVIRKQYFAAWIRDLEKCGLRPVQIRTDLPVKLNLAYAFVVAEPLSGNLP